MNEWRKNGQTVSIRRRSGERHATHITGYSAAGVNVAWPKFWPECEGLKTSTPELIVHHKKKLTPENINDPAVALSFDNLELLCDEHHNRQHKAKAKRYTFDAKGNLIESK